VDHERRADGLAALFAGFVRRYTGAALCVHDLDADGLTSGVLWQRCMERLGRDRIERLIARRDRNVWFGEYDDQLQATAPEVLYVLDLGCQTRTLSEGVPTCVVDHHAPSPPAAGTLLLSSYGWDDPPPPTAWLMYRLASELVDMSDLDWIAAVGTEGDLGSSAPFELLASMKGKHRRKDLAETVALVNAVRRSSRPRPELAAEALLLHPSPRALVESREPCVLALRQAREEVRLELAKAKMAAPRFSGQVALVEVDSPCQVHPVVAQIWRGRLKKYYVLVANKGYMPERINFSARSNPPLKVLDFLRALPEYSGESGFGQGHDYASGGSLDLQAWGRMLERLGFSPPAGG
jgi:single-stranded-DNA-specific exonuclease